MQAWNKIFISCSLSVFITMAGYSQTMPQMNVITSPKMPTISSPTIGKGFYSPEISSPSFPEISTAEETLNKSKTEPSSVKEVKAQETADFDLYSFLINSYTESSQTSSGKILRFNASQKDILSNSKNINIDSLENRSIIISGTNFQDTDSTVCTENFYMMFVPDTTKNALTDYKVLIYVNQSQENDSTPLYKLSKTRDITATRTGNLLKLNTAEADFLADLGDL